MKNRFIGARAVAAALAAVGPLSAHATTVVAQWNAAALQEVRLGKLGPPVVARALAVAHTCMYDAWAAYDAKAVPTASGVAQRPASESTDANKHKAISFAAYRCLSNLFPAGDGRLNAQMRQLGYDPTDSSTNPATPQGVGNLAAAAVIAARRNDGSNQYGDLAPGAYGDWTGYAPRNAPAPFCDPLTVAACPPNATDLLHWQPLVNDKGVLQKFVAPHWEQVTPFALSSADQFDSRPDVISGPNYLKGAAAYQADVDQMVAISGSLTPQQKLIVEYWADGPDSELPPGHWGLFAQHVSQRDNHTIDQDVKMFFAMHNASHDAGIVAWHLKRKWDGVRPITAVRALKNGQQIQAWGGPGQPNRLVPGEKWSPYNPGSNLTPSFPGWVSGHSTFSAASATALRNFKGNDTLNYSATLHANFGRVEGNVPPVPTTLTYPTYSSAVADAGMSRLYAGIHFADDNTVGQTLGNLAGQQAWDKAQYLFDGGLRAGSGSRAGSGFASALSWSHNVPADSQRLLLVSVSTKSNIAANSVSFAGRPLQRLGVQSDAFNDNRIELWYLAAPPAGTFTVNVNLAGFGDVVGGAANYAGVNQATPFGTLRAGRGEGTSACVTLANEPAALVAAFTAANGDAGGVQAGAGLATQFAAISDGSLLGGILSFLLNSSYVYGIGSAGPAAPVASVCNRLNQPRRWATLAVPLRPAFAN